MAFSLPDRPRATLDIECYRNFFLVCLRSCSTGKVVAYPQFEGQKLDVYALKRILAKYTIITFNGRNYDVPMLSLALVGATCKQLKEASDRIIQKNMKPWDFERHYGVSVPRYIDHIDLIEVAPGMARLKIYGGRIHSLRMQDLPIHFDADVTVAEREVLTLYCGNDLQTTDDLAVKLAPQLSLRDSMSVEYGQDLRSKSDAQIAEAVIRSKLEELTGQKVSKPSIPPGTRFKYKAPAFIQFETEQMQQILATVLGADFVLSPKSKVVMPPELKGLKIPLGDSVYRMGIGGLHSSEKCATHYSDAEFVLLDRDVASYYPALILNMGLYPAHLGPKFLDVYRGIVNRRLSAKDMAEIAKKAREAAEKSGDTEGVIYHKGVEAKWKIEADSLKITINGSFGKFGNKYSILFSPHLLIQTTVTGQLALLMLIERLHIRGISVVSANTDGVVIKCPRSKLDLMQSIVEQWEKDTNLKTEEKRYVALYSRDVNNYIAIMEKRVKVDADDVDYLEDLGSTIEHEMEDGAEKFYMTVKGDVKYKGAYAEPGLQKNPSNAICVEAVVDFLKHGTPIEETVRWCWDIRKFVTIRTVNKGGGVYDGEYLGKAVRWYMATGPKQSILAADDGSLVAGSEGCRPLMQIPATLPDDVDYDWYIEKAKAILVDIGVVPKPPKPPKPMTKKRLGELVKQFDRALEELEL